MLFLSYIGQGSHTQIKVFYAFFFKIQKVLYEKIVHDAVAFRARIIAHEINAGFFFSITNEEIGKGLHLPLGIQYAGNGGKGKIVFVKEAQGKAFVLSAGKPGIRNIFQILQKAVGKRRIHYFEGVAFIFQLIDCGTKLFSGFSYEIKSGKRDLCSLSKLHKFIAVVMEEQCQILPYLIKEGSEIFFFRLLCEGRDSSRKIFFFPDGLSHDHRFSVFYGKLKSHLILSVFLIIVEQLIAKEG